MIWIGSSFSTGPTCRQRRIRSLDGICNRAFDWCWSDVLDLSWFFVSRQMGPFLEVVEWNTCCQTASCFKWVDSLPFLVQMLQQSELHPKLNFEVIFMLLYPYVAQLLSSKHQGLWNGHSAQETFYKLNKYSSAPRHGVETVRLCRWNQDEDASCFFPRHLWTCFNFQQHSCKHCYH